MSGRDELSDNGQRLMIHATDDKLALNPFRPPEPLHILNPSNFVPKNGFPVVKGLTRTMLRLFVVYRTRFRVLTEERPSTGLTTY